MSTWMVVEDEPDLYDTLLALFEIWSIDGVAFTNGTDAIKWIEDVDQGVVDSNLPELALLDIRLPGASGPEIGKRLRQSPVLKDITIVLMTTYHLSLEEEKTVMSTAGADTLIYKPLPSPAEFRALLQRAITGRNLMLAEQKAAAAQAPAAEASPAKPAEEKTLPATEKAPPAAPKEAPAAQAPAPVSTDKPAAPEVPAKAETPTQPAPPKPDEAAPKADAEPAPPPIKQAEDKGPPK